MHSNQKKCTAFVYIIQSFIQTHLNVNRKLLKHCEVYFYIKNQIHELGFNWSVVWLFGLIHNILGNRYYKIKVPSIA